MQPTRELKVRIHPDGRVEVETDGFVGPSCANVSQLLAEAVAGPDAAQDDVSIRFKPAYYMREDRISLEDEVKDES